MEKPERDISTNRVHDQQTAVCFDFNEFVVPRGAHAGAEARPLRGRQTETGAPGIPRVSCTCNIVYLYVSCSGGGRSVGCELGAEASVGGDGGFFLVRGVVCLWWKWFE